MTDRHKDGRTMRTITIAGPHIVVGQLKMVQICQNTVK